MIAINKSEKEALVKRFPHVHIVRTMKKKSKRHRYYCEESLGVVKFINALRGDAGNYEDKKGDGRHKSRKNA